MGKTTKRDRIDTEAAEAQRGQKKRPKKKRRARDEAAGRGRLAKAELQRAIAEKYCRRCKSLGRFAITGTKGRVRHLRCLVCGQAEQIAV